MLLGLLTHDCQSSLAAVAIESNGLGPLNALASTHSVD